MKSRITSPVRNRWSCLLALALLTLHIADVRAGEEHRRASEVELITVVYDLSDVGPRISGEVAELDLLPLDLRTGDWDEQSEDDFTYEMDERLSDHLESFLWDVLAPAALSVEGAEVSIPDEQRLRLTAPVAVHAALREVLASIHAATHRRAVVEIEVYRVETAAAVQDDGDPAEPAEAGELITRRTEELVLGRTAVRRAEQRHPFVREWEVEIAERSFAAVPRVDAFDVGVTWMLRVEPGLSDGRFHLRWAQRTSELLGLDARVVESLGEAALDTKVMSRSPVGMLEQPRLAVSTTAGSRRLAVGDAVSVLTHADSLGQGHGLLTRYRLVSVDPAPEPVRLPDGQMLTVLDASTLWWGGLEPPRVERSQLSVPYAGWESPDRLVFPGPGWEWGDEPLAALAEAVRAGSSAGDVWRLGAWRVLVGDPAALAAARSALAASLPASPAVTLELGVERRDARGGHAVLGRVDLPLQAGAAGLALVGVAGTTLRGFEVDVANSAAAPEATVGGFLDGLVVTARAHADGTVSVDALLHKLVEEDQVDLQTRFLGSQDRQVFHVLHERERLAADGRLHRWGGLGLSADGALELRVRVVPR